MTIRLGLRSLAATLPVQLQGWLQEKGLEPSFRADVGAPTGYVWPDLIDEPGAEESPILLVTAPGAMGKSAAARAVAASLHAPLIDLARLPIGSDSLTGLLTRVLDWDQAPDFVKALRGGKAALVLDSLDEAHLASGQTHFSAFLKNVAELVRGGASASQVVIFGRRDTIETASLLLSEYGVEPRQLSVAPLTLDQSCELIDLVLDDVHLGDARFETHRKHSVPFGRLRSSMLLDMAGALGASERALEDAWDKVGDFLGYPPVLMVLARHLVVDNPTALTAGSHSHGSANTRGGLLLEVTEEILDRESTKVQAQLGTILGLSEDDPLREILYTREEQVVRIYGYMAGQALTVPLPSALTAEQSAIYQDQIGAFVPDHPFLRGREIENVVFDDYLKAYTALAPALQLQAFSAAYIDGQAVGPFFAHFLHAMAPAIEVAGETGRVSIVAENFVDALIKSFSSGTNYPHSFVYSDGPKHPMANLFLSEHVAEASEGKVLSFLDFRVSGRSGLLELSSPLSRGVIISQGAVSISAPADEVALGPDLVVFADELFIGGHRVTVTSTSQPSNSPNGGVWIMSRQQITHEHDLRINAHPPGALTVTAPDLWHQWRPYIMEISGLLDGVNPELSWQVMFGLRRILTGFHASAKDDPSLFAERFDRFIVGNNSVFAAILDGLLELGVVSREATLYRLRLARLSEYQVNYVAMRGSEFATALKRLHADVFKTRAMAEVLRDTAD